MATLFVLGAGCSDDGAAPDEKKTVASNPECGPLGTREDGSCCPAGSAYVHADDTCLAVGPPTCATSIFASPSTCVPSWCWDRLDGGDKPCTTGADCRVVGRVCTAQELSAGQGCAAGTYPDAKGGCHAAGTMVADASQPAAPKPFIFDQVCPAGFAVDPSITPGAGQLPRCAPKADACGSTPFPKKHSGDGQPFTTTLYVLDSAATGGDGSKDKPFKTLAEALTNASGLTLLVVGEGIYTFGAELPANITIQGRCTAKTIVKGVASNTTVTATGVGKRALYDLTITGPNKGLYVLGGATVHLVKVRINGARSAALKVSGFDSSVLASDLLIDDTGELLKPKNPSNYKLFGRGAELLDGAQLSVVRARICNSRDIAVHISGKGTKMDATDFVVDGTREVAKTGAGGIGMALFGGAKASVSGGRFHGNRTIGVRAVGIGTLFDARRTIIDHTRKSAILQEGAYHGQGLVLVAGGKAKLDRVRVSHNRRHSVAVDGGELVATDLQISDTAPEPNGYYGRALVLFNNSVAHLTRTRVLRNRGVAILSRQSSLTAFDMLVDDTKGWVADNKDGRGLDIGEGSSLYLTRTRVNAAHDAGIFVSGAAAKAEFRDVTVEGTRRDIGDNVYGVGVHLGDGAVLSAQRLRLHSNRYGGIVVRSGASAKLSDVRIKGNPQDATDHGGAFLIRAKSSADVERMVIDGAVRHGILTGADTELTLRDVLISDTLPGGEGGGFGRAIDAEHRSDVRLFGVHVRRAHEWGVGGFEPDIRAVGMVVEGTLPAAGKANHGEGIVGYTELQEGPMRGSLTISASVVRGNHTAGIIGFRTKLKLDHVVVANTRPASLTRTNRATREQLKQLLADGLLVFNSNAVVTRSIFAANDRAGAVTSGVEGMRLSGSYVTTNAMGVARIGAASADTGGSIVNGNRIANFVTGGLVIPAVPKRVAPAGD